MSWKKLWKLIGRYADIVMTAQQLEIAVHARFDGMPEDDAGREIVELADKLADLTGAKKMTFALAPLGE